MVKRVLAWIAVLAGGLVTIESVFIAHKLNWVWILIPLIGIAYFAKNGFLRHKRSAPTGASYIPGATDLIIARRNHPAVSGRPLPGEYAAYAQLDIDLVVGDDACEVLLRQQDATISLFEKFGDAGGDLAYDQGKWSVKQVLGHLADDERIFAYRALCIARGDSRELPGFDEVQYVAGADFTRLAMEQLLADYLAVRAASVALFRNLTPEAWSRRGVVNGYQATPRGLAFHIAGHELHHHRVIAERYVPIARVLPWWPATR